MALDLIGARGGHNTLGRTTDLYRDAPGASWAD
jgi:hypothetical protein